MELAPDADDAFVAEGELDAGVQGDTGGLVPRQRLDDAQGVLHLEGPDAGGRAVGLLEEGEAVDLALGQRLFGGDGGLLGANVLEVQAHGRLDEQAAFQIVQAGALLGRQHEGGVGGDAAGVGLSSG